MDGCERGFTLLELMVGLALLALLLMLATPPLRELIAVNRAAVHAQTVMTSLFLARTEAVKRNQRVTLCKSADGAVCTTAGDWSQGWLVFVDGSTFGIRDPAEEVVRIQQGLGDDFTLRNANAANWYAYRPDGSAVSSGGLVTGTFRVCPGNGDAKLAYRVITNITGRPRVAKGIGSLSCP
jgi:type IV fimbrial biogenesis protein FimT